GITTLIVAGIGISNAVNSYLWKKRQSIAIMKSLGANRRHIYFTYLLQIVLVSIIAIALGLALGTTAEFLVIRKLSEMLPVTGERGIYYMPLLISAALGLTTVLL